MTDKKIERTVKALLKHAGQTYAEQAGIRLADTPAPLYQLLVLSTLLSASISADVAASAMKELRKAGFTTAEHMREATWQQRVDALGRGHYRRYDESTATKLGDGAGLLLARYRGDLRRLAAESERDIDRVATGLREFPGIGPTGAQIFLREVQEVWSWLRPYADRRVQEGAKKLRLPTDPDRLFQLVETTQAARLSAALVRVQLDDKLADTIRGASRRG